MLRHRWSASAFRLGMALTPALGMAACTATPPPASSVAAADPGVRVPATRYRPVKASDRFQPAEPRPWQGPNRDVASPPPDPRGQVPWGLLRLHTADVPGFSRRPLPPHCCWLRAPPSRRRPEWGL